MINFIRNILKDFYHYIKGNRLPNLKKIRKSFKFKNKKKKNILIATSAGGLKSQLVLESLVALGVENQDCNVEFYLCDGNLKGCIMATHENIKEKKIINKKNPLKDICDRCFKPAFKYLRRAGYKVNKLSDYVSEDEINQILENDYSNLSIEELKNFRSDSIKIGEHSYSGALRYYAKTDLNSEKNGKNILISYFKSSLIVNKSINRLFEKKKYDEVFLNHGIYVPQGLIIDVAKKHDIKTSTWCPGYRKKTFSFTRGDTYHRSLIYENNDNWEKINFNNSIKNKVENYLNSRQLGTNDWIHFYKSKPNFEIDKYLKKIGVDLNKPLIGMATSVMWDAQIDFPSNFFKNSLEWVFDTIDFFIKNSHLQLIIRISPAEVNEAKPARQKVYDEIKKKYITLPKNIFVILPQDTISSYAILNKCENIIIYGSRIGIELAAMGKQVIVCGEGFIRNKNIAKDILSKEQYFNVLNSLPLSDIQMPKDFQIRAKKYAYHFFFRRMIKIISIEEKLNKWPNFTISKNIKQIIDEKKDFGLNCVVNSLIEGKDYIFEQEKYD